MSPNMLNDVCVKHYVPAPLGGHHGVGNGSWGITRRMGDAYGRGTRRRLPLAI
jgi:hypothetical protein